MCGEISEEQRERIRSKGCGDIVFTKSNIIELMTAFYEECCQQTDYRKRHQEAMESVCSDSIGAAKSFMVMNEAVSEMRSKEVKLLSPELSPKEYGIKLQGRRKR